MRDDSSHTLALKIVGKRNGIGSNPMPLRFLVLDISKRAWRPAFSLNSGDLAGRFRQLA